MRGDGASVTAPGASARLEARERRLSRPWIMRQRWRHLLFLHWEVPVEEVQRTLPPGLYVDTHEGRAHVGIVPFFMEGIRLRCLPALPGASAFQELNLRTYVYDDSGVPGVWFYTLDAANRLAVAIARRFFHLRYRFARMRAEIGNEITYESKATGDGQSCRFVYECPQPGGEAYPPDSLEFFLLERYCLFAFDNRRRLFRGFVRHSPYLVRPLRVRQHDAHLFAASPFRAPASPPMHVVGSAGVDVAIYPIEEIGRF